MAEKAEKAEKVGAYGNKAADAGFRKKWDKEEYAEKAKQKDKDERERMQKNEELLRKGKKPRRIKEELPKPTELMKQRDYDLELDKNLGKTILVQSAGGRGPGQPGFYCEVCQRTHKDTVGYLDHINSRAHLRRLGQTTTIARSTVEQVRARIALLREKTKEAADAKSYDFEKRLQQIKDKENEERAEKRQQKKAARRAVVSLPEAMEVDTEMAQTMGFAGFGSTKK